jgi:uncharacterized membrane protein
MAEPASVAAQTDVARGVWQILWDDLPILTYLAYAFSIANTELSNLDPPRGDLFLSCLFPLVVPAALYALRWPRAQRLERLVAMVLFGGTLLLLGIVYVGAPAFPLRPGTLRTVYEASSIANMLLLAAHAATYTRGWLGLFLGPVALYGVLLENGGILLGYFEELDYHLYLGPLPAPIATMSGWITVFYVVTQVSWLFAREVAALRVRPMLMALIATAAALLLDLQIDPLATAVGFWRWDHHLPAGFLGVPILNFVAWGSAVLPFAYVLFWYQTRRALTPVDLGAWLHIRWLLLQVPLVLAAAAVLFCVSMIVAQGGVYGPAYDILVQTLARWGLVVAA